MSQPKQSQSVTLVQQLQFTKKCSGSAADCSGFIEPDRALRAATRYCRNCAARLRRARVADWKRRKLTEIGKEQFRADYSLCREKRRAYMLTYMRARRASSQTEPLR